MGHAVLDDHGDSVGRQIPFHPANRILTLPKQAITHVQHPYNTVPTLPLERFVPTAQHVVHPGHLGVQPHMATCPLHDLLAGVVRQVYQFPGFAELGLLGLLPVSVSFLSGVLLEPAVVLFE